MGAYERRLKAYKFLSRMGKKSESLLFSTKLLGSYAGAAANGNLLREAPYPSFGIPNQFLSSLLFSFTS